MWQTTNRQHARTKHTRVTVFIDRSQTQLLWTIASNVFVLLRRRPTLRQKVQSQGENEAARRPVPLGEMECKW